MRRPRLIILALAVLFGPGSAIVYAEREEEFLQGLRARGLLELAGIHAESLLAKGALSPTEVVDVQLQLHLTRRDQALASGDPARMQKSLEQLVGFIRSHPDDPRAESARLESVSLRAMLARLRAQRSGTPDVVPWQSVRDLKTALSDILTVSTRFARDYETQRREYAKLVRAIHRQQVLGKKYGALIGRRRVLERKLRRYREKAAQADFLAADLQRQMAYLFPASHPTRREQLREAAEAFAAYYDKYKNFLLVAYLGRAIEVECLLLLSDYGEARERTEAALLELKNSPLARHEKARQTVRDAGGQLTYLRARIENEDKHYDRAHRIAQEGLQAFAEHEGIQLEYGIAQIHKDKKTQGIVRIVQAARHGGTYVSRALDALATLNESDLGKAEKITDPIRIQIAQRLYQSERYAQVVQFLESRITRLSSEDSLLLSAYSILADALLRTDRRDQAVAVLERFADRFPKQPHGQSALQRAIAIQMSLAESTPPQDTAWENLRRLLGAYAKLYPTDPWIHLARGDLQYGQRQYRAAIEHYQAIGKKTGHYADARIKMADAGYRLHLVSSDNPDAAILKKAIDWASQGILWCRERLDLPTYQADPDRLARTAVSGEVLLSVCLTQAQLYARVVAEYATFAAEHPGEEGIGLVEHNLLISQLRLDQRAEALARLRAFRAESPKSPQLPSMLLAVRDDYAGAWKQASADPKAARKLLEVAVWAGREHIASARDAKITDYLQTAQWMAEAGQHESVVQLLLQAQARFTEANAQTMEGIRFHLARGCVACADPKRLTEGIAIFRALNKDARKETAPHIDRELALALLKKARLRQPPDPTELSEAVTLLENALASGIHPQLSVEWSALEWRRIRAVADLGQHQKATALIRYLSFITDDFRSGTWSAEQRQDFNRILKGDADDATTP